MTTKTVGGLSGLRMAAMLCAGLWVPSAALAADQNVVVVNPTNGNSAVVKNGSLHVLDTMAQYRNDPGNFVNLDLPSYAGDGCSGASYTVPQGEALIITSIQGNFYNSDGISYSGISLYTGAGCGGTELLREFVPVPTQVGAVAAKSFQFGNGIPVPAGSVLSIYDYSDTGFNFIQGYLVPATLVQTAGVQSSSGLRSAGRPGPSSR